ncbi:hypothetical protein Tco_1210204 [Tanacetum coccineum]
MLSMSSQTIPGSVRSLDPFDLHSDLWAGISNLCLDPPILWSSLKVSRSIVVPLIVLFRPPFLFVWRLCEFFSLWRPDLLRLVWWFSPPTEMAMVVALLLQFDIFFLLQIASMVAFKKTQVLLGEFPGSHIDHTSIMNNINKN